MPVVAMSATEAFFDTNVLLYKFTDDAEKASISENVMRSGGVISVQVLNEFASACRRKHEAAWAIIREIFGEYRANLTVVPMTIETHDRGLELAERYQLNVYDGMIIAAAQLAGCKVLYSEDMHDGLVIDGLTLRNPYACK
jgi:predicted nucleic acid-binding protein